MHNEKFGIDLDMIPKGVLPSEFLEHETKKMKMYNNQKSLMHVDMIEIKDSIKGTIYFKRLCSTPPQPDEIDEFEFDYWNLDLIRLLSQVDNTRFEETERLVSEFEDAYSEISDELSESDVEIFQYHRNGITEENISLITEKYSIDRRNIYKRIKRILEIIQRKMIENYEINYYYTEKVRGNWKKCSKCGESYPRNTYYWSKDKGKSDGFKYYCKKCESIMKKS